MTTLITTAEGVGDALMARLAEIQVANGYETDMGLKQFRGARRVDDTMLPCCVLIEGDDEVARTASRTQYQVRQKYALLAYVPCDANNPNIAAHKALRDLKRCVFTRDGAPDWTLGRQVRSVAYNGREIAARPDGLRFVVAAVEVEVEFVEDLSLP